MLQRSINQGKCWEENREREISRWARNDEGGRGLAGPDAGGEGFDGVEAEIFVELDGGVVFGGDGEGEFAELHGAEGFGGSLHEHAAEAVSLVAGQDAELRGVADAGGDFAGEDGGDEVGAARRMKNGRG